MSKYLISVIIPAYNASNTLPDCLESVFNSSYSHFECIVVDDYSADNSLEIARSFPAKVIALDRRRGAAHARNRGAENALGDILFFVDADVTIYPDTMYKIATAFTENPQISALFGSYDDEPAELNFLSQYKNLFHHFIHQTSLEEATTFFTACGAIRKEVFISIGKFNEKCRMMEDIELGYQLHSRNHKILLLKDLVVKHFKRYTFFSLIKSDLLDRAIPWTVLMLGNRQFTGDLNFKLQHKLSAIIVFLVIGFSLLTFLSPWFSVFALFLLVVYLICNFDFYSFFLRKRGIVFSLQVLPFHLFYYIYSTVGFLIGLIQYSFNKYSVSRNL